MTGTDRIADRESLDDECALRLAAIARDSRLAALGEMASAMAHELNQPLAAIVNYVEACVREIRAGAVDPARVVEDLEAIRSQAVRAAETVREVRSLVHREPPTARPANVSELIEEVVTMLEPEARRFGATIRTEFDEELPFVDVERGQIQLVVIDLARNGLEAMASAQPTPRTLTVASRRAPDHAVEIVVTNTGSTLDAETSKRVFEPFFTTKPNGMGLGLSVARRIVDAHRGRLWCDELDGEAATTFAFSLPAAEGRDGE